MRVLLVRHAPTAETGRRLPGPPPGAALTPAGEQAAAATARGLADHDVAVVITSPARRCRQTADAVGTVVGVRCRVDRAFSDVDFGDWSGRRLGDLRRLAAWKTLMTAPARFRFPSGENLEEVRHRAVTAIEGLAAEHGDRTVVVVSHADVIRALLCHYLGMPLDLIHRLDVAPASVSEVVLEGSRVLVPRVNTTVTAV